MGITAQPTRTWRRSNEPFYEPKKNWVLDGVVVSFDECGPISLRPETGGSRPRSIG